MSNTLQALIETLARHNISTKGWRHPMKTIEDLYSELESGESALVVHENKLTRFSFVTAVRVYYQHPEHGLLFLKENLQDFYGSVVSRPLLNPVSSISEKRFPGEGRETAAHRALREELKIEEELALVECHQQRRGPGDSLSYPGLLTIRDIVVFETLLPEHLYEPGGYVETQAKKTSYFVWIRAEDVFLPTHLSIG